MVPMTILPRKSAMAENDWPPLVDNQMPPVAAPTRMRLASRGSMSTARRRPPTLPGPRAVHELVEMPAARLRACSPTPAPVRPVLDSALRSDSARRMSVEVGVRPNSSISHVRIHSFAGERNLARSGLRKVLRYAAMIMLRASGASAQAPSLSTFAPSRNWRSVASGMSSLVAAA